MLNARSGRSRTGRPARFRARNGGARKSDWELHERPSHTGERSPLLSRGRTREAAEQRGLPPYHHGSLSLPLGAPGRGTSSKESAGAGGGPPPWLHCSGLGPTSWLGQDGVRPSLGAG